MAEREHHVAMLSDIQGAGMHRVTVEGIEIVLIPLRGDGPSIRVEHWRAAEQQGRTAAMKMPGRSVRDDAVPMF
jgi:hypothetical protein